MKFASFELQSIVGGKWLNRVVTVKDIVDLVKELLGASYLWHVSY